MQWLQSRSGGSKSEAEACAAVGEEFKSECGKCAPGPELTPKPSPAPPPPPSPSPPKQEGLRCNKASCTSAVLATMADGHSCQDRVKWLQSSAGGSKAEVDACSAVGWEFPQQCGKCAPTQPPSSSSSSSSGKMLKVMSYNTEYKGYPSRVGQYGAKIREVGAAVVGTQENQDAGALLC